MKKVILMGVPHHNNLGDNAITIAEKQYINDNFKEYKYYEISEETLIECVEKAKKHIDENDIIFLHGGGNLGDQYLYVEDARRKVIQTFPNNTIILFPQTIYFTKTKKGEQELEKSKQIYSKHKRLIILAREEISFEIIKKEFSKNTVLQTPDIVTYLNKTKEKEKREGVLFILRNDVEGKVSIEQLELMEKAVKKYFKKIEYSDTARGEGISEKDREKRLEEMLNKYRKAKLVITDRLHGMIFAAITSTPCIALDNYNHKIKGCSETLKDFKYVKYIDNMNEIEENINYLITNNFDMYNNEFAIESFEKIKDAVI